MDNMMINGIIALRFCEVCQSYNVTALSISVLVITVGQ